jgi:hypothetical protein
VNATLSTIASARSFSARTLARWLSIAGSRTIA